MNVSDTAILRAFQERGWRRADLMRAHPELGDIGRNLERLYSQCFLNREAGAYNLGATYTLASKGRRLLGRREREEPVGKIASPREVDVMRGPVYTGSTFTPPRAGSLRAFELPSLQGSQRVERKRPAIIGSNPEANYRGLP
jgi:hypothetical protein